MKKFLTVVLSSSLLLSGVVYAEEASSESAASQAESSEEVSESAESTEASEQIEASNVQQAFDDAVKAFQEAYPDADIIEIDVELLNDETFEIELDGIQDTTEIEVTYMSREGKIVSQSEEVTNDTEVALDLDKVISIDEATEIANGETGFTQPTNWVLDNLGNQVEKPVWEIEYDQGSEEAELEIDALTGEVVKVEIDD